MPNQLPTPKPWWKVISRWLTPRRLSYACITGIVLWVAWLASIVFGSGNFDLANQVVGTDFIQFYAAGMTLDQHAEQYLYDFAYQSQLQQEIAGPGLSNFHAFITPPFLAWIFVPWAKLPYVWSFVLWSGFNLLALWASLRVLGAHNPRNSFLWVLSWFPVFASISFGQNSLLSLFLLSLTYIFWQRQHNFSAGLIASLVLFKPQLLIGITLLWLIRWRRDWKALTGLLVGVGTLTTLTFLFLPSAASSYLKLALEFIPGLIYGDQFPLYHLHALRGFWTLLFPGNAWLAEGASLLLSSLGLVFFFRFIQHNHSRPALQFTAAIALTILITPHAMIYDWSLLLIPAILLWQSLPKLEQYWKVIFAVVWLVMLLSGPLTSMQLKILPIALQISVPVYCYLLVDILRTLNHSHPGHLLSPEQVEGS